MNVQVLPHVQPHYRTHGAHAGAQSQLVCGGCRTLLMYPQGSSNVRCARCGHITAVPPPGGNEMAQLVCSNPQCRVVLMYPRGANQVQCSVCATVNCAMAANQIGHIVCGACSITLMYAHGAQQVKCAVCNNVTPVNSATITMAPQGQEGAGCSSQHSKTVSVVVHNPPTLDDEGNEVQNIAVGVATVDKHAAVTQS